MAVSIVAWRASPDARPASSTRRSSSRRVSSAMSNRRSWPAASSSARGTSSSRRHSSTTAGSAGSQLPPGLGGPGPLDEQRGSPVVQRAERPQVLAGHAQRLAAGGQDPGGIAAGQHAVGEPAGVVEDMLAVVQHQQDGAGGQMVGHLVDGVGGRALDAGGLGHRPGDVRPRRDRRQVDEHGAVGVLGVQAAGRRQGHGGLADAAGAAHGDQRGLPDQVDDAGDVAVPPDGGVAQPGAAPAGPGRRPRCRRSRPAGPCGRRRRTGSRGRGRSG